MRNVNEKVVAGRAPWLFPNPRGQLACLNGKGTCLVLGRNCTQPGHLRMASSDMVTTTRCPGRWFYFYPATGHCNAMFGGGGGGGE